MTTTGPVGAGHVGFSAMGVCATCFELRGAYDGHWQQCDCDREANPQEYETRCRTAVGALYDFNKAVELCRCCAVALVPSGSRWSIFFCDECKRRVLALNSTLGRWVIPIGRHSVMHGESLGAAEFGSDERVKEFTFALDGLFDRIAHLDLFARAVVEENLKTLGLMSERRVQLKVYLEAAIAQSRTKEAAFTRLCAHFDAGETSRRLTAPSHERHRTPRGGARRNSEASGRRRNEHASQTVVPLLSPQPSITRHARAPLRATYTPAAWNRRCACLPLPFDRSAALERFAFEGTGDCIVEGRRLDEGLWEVRLRP